MEPQLWSLWSREPAAQDGVCPLQLERVRFLSGTGKEGVNVSRPWPGRTGLQCLVGPT